MCSSTFRAWTDSSSSRTRGVTADTDAADPTKTELAEDERAGHGGVGTAKIRDEPLFERRARRLIAMNLHDRPFDRDENRRVDSRLELFQQLEGLLQGRQRSRGRLGRTLAREPGAVFELPAPCLSPALFTRATRVTHQSSYSHSSLVRSRSIEATRGPAPTLALKWRRKPRACCVATPSRAPASPSGACDWPCRRR